MSGWVLLGGLLVVMATLRLTGYSRTDTILEGERLARETCLALRAASEALVADGPHPGLAAVCAAVPGLRFGTSEAARSYASDDVYRYGLHARERRQADGNVLHDYVLRAWPCEYGVTGDMEYLVQDGRLWVSHNSIGRSGREVGFPPPFPAPDAADRGVWWKDREAH